MPLLIPGRAGLFGLAGIIGVASERPPLVLQPCIAASSYAPAFCVRPAVARPRAVIDFAGTARGRSTREALSVATNRAPCADCHARLEGVGFAFEQFDLRGQARRETADASWVLVDAAPESGTAWSRWGGRSGNAGRSPPVSSHTGSGMRNRGRYKTTPAAGG
jgi:hypothetical protein